MGNNLSKRLASFVSDDDSFSSPFTQPNTGFRVSDIEKMTKKDSDESESPRQRKKKSKFERLAETISEIDSMLSQDESIQAFDDFISDYIVDEEDYELKQSLISQGRKYARDTKISKEASELTKVYSGNEKLINDVIESANSDIDSITKDINQIRSIRTGRNTKLLSDMCEIKKDLYGVVLSAVKESNSMKTKMIELQAKLAKDKAAEGADGDASGLVTRAIGSLIGGGKGNALSVVGGYAGVSGALGADEDYGDVSSDDDEDTFSMEEDFVNDEDEGRKYLKYEGMGVQLIATQSRDGSMHVTAEDRDGNELPEYPLPPNADHQNFVINEKLGTATDDCYRRYVFRKDYE